MKAHIPELTIAFLVLTGTASANVIVDYDSGSQAGSNVDQATVTTGLELGGGLADDEHGVVTLADNSPSLYSTTAGDYTGPAFGLVWDGIALNESANWDSRDSNPISIRFQTSAAIPVGGTANGGNFHLAIFFPTAGSSSFDATSSLAVDFNRTENAGDIRWLVRDGSTYYLSQSIFTTDATLSGASLLAENWAVYDIASGADFDQGSATYTTGTAALTDINAVGFMADKDAVTAVRHWVELNTFTVDAVVPEPSTFAAVLGLIGLLAVIRRRR